MTPRFAWRALALLSVAAIARADDRVGVEIHLFHGPADAIADAGVSSAVPAKERGAPHELPKWTKRVEERADWQRIVEALGRAEGVQEIPLDTPVVTVTAERPWQLDGTVKVPLAQHSADGKLTVTLADVPLRVAAWIEGDEPDSHLKVEALVPTMAPDASDSAPVASRVELTLTDQPLIAVTRSCDNPSCRVTVLAVRRTDPPK